MRFGSVCSGIEAATLAWEPLGFEPVFYSEIDPFCCALLLHYYDTPNYGDMTEYKGWKDESIDILVGGTPCQSFSVAGLRKGLDDPRGNLALVYLGIVDRYWPRWVVWENVPGVLSSNEGRDFGAFIGALEQLGYGWAYRTLDAQFYRVPQRRRRVFVVGHLGDWRGSAAVLFEPEILSGNTPPSREKGQGIAATPEGIAGACSSKLNKASGRGFERAGESRGQDPVVAFSCKDSGQDSGEISPTLRAMNHDGSHANAGGQVAVASFLTSPALCSQAGGPASQDWKQHVSVVQGMQVRRLTPLECERLQGFPDNYTLIPYRGKPAADSPRYKAIGNSMAVPVMRWIGRRIRLFEEMTE